MGVYIASVRHSKPNRGKLTIEKFYASEKGWYILRPKNVKVAMTITAEMIGKWGTTTDLSGEYIVKECVEKAIGKKIDTFSTETEVQVLMETNKFEKLTFKLGTILYTGDILVTKSKGHTAIVISGAPRNPNHSCYPVFMGSTMSIVDALTTLGIDASYANRKKIATANKIKGYRGLAVQNLLMLNLLKQGKLKKAK